MTARAFLEFVNARYPVDPATPFIDGMTRHAKLHGYVHFEQSAVRLVATFEHRDSIALQHRFDRSLHGSLPISRNAYEVVWNQACKAVAR